MKNLEKYKSVFIEAFEIDKNQLEALAYQDIEAWDSVGHMGLIALLEEEFDITLEMDDIIDFSSYSKGKDLLKKYNVTI